MRGRASVTPAQSRETELTGFAAPVVPVSAHACRLPTPCVIGVEDIGGRSALGASAATQVGEVRNRRGSEAVSGPP